MASKLLGGKDHKFWNTQPVPQNPHEVVENEPIDEFKTTADVKPVSYFNFS